MLWWWYDCLDLVLVKINLKRLPARSCSEGRSELRGKGVIVNMTICPLYLRSVNKSSNSSPTLL